MPLTPTQNSQGLRRIAIGVQYDGAFFSGWQSQLNGNTIQDHLESAINDFVGENPKTTIRTTAAGRTDAGVHAIGQVAHFDTSIDRPDWSWVRGLNSFLPAEISIQWAKHVPFEFDARFSAFERSYVYFVVSSPVKTPLLNKKAGYLMLAPDRSLLIEEMQSAASLLIGEHDFSSFRSSECQSKTPVKVIHQLDIIQEGCRLYFFIRA
jgi:tRNA pseudouridine38-40 synthase